MEKLNEAQKDWEKGLEKFLANNPERKATFTTLSDIPIKRLYTPLDIEKLDYDQDLGNPGEFPYTRGIYPTMYLGKLWTMRQFSGFGTALDTNKRYKYLLEHGQTGLSVAFHMPTIMGYDSDHPRSRGEVGRCGVAIDTLADMEDLFCDIPLDKVTTSMTINAPAAILLAMYMVVAEKQGVSWKVIGGTIQNDILKEYIAQKSWIFPPRPSMKIITDIFEFCSQEVPRWNTISISGYHIREAGATAVQELAFTLADGIAYVEAGMEAGLAPDSFAPRLSFFFNAHNDFFEEIAKFRAARRLWSKIMRERIKAKEPRSWLLRFHTQTAGCSLTAQQPENNIVRVALQALAAVLGGTQSLHTNSMDEVLSLPTEEAVTIALRTQQIIAHESGIANTIDPFAGSYYLETLTNEMEERAQEYIDKIDALGGMIAAIEKGFPQREIMEAAYNYQKTLESKERIVVGVNAYNSGETAPIEILKIPPQVEEEQVRRLQRVREKRDYHAHQKALSRLETTARQGDNLMPAIIEAVRAYASIGEIIDVLRGVFGEYKDPAFF
jgi:methylmalonyl-CoA mutase N-terminal domain/subunit